MKYNHNLSHLKAHLSTHLSEVVASHLCQEAIERLKVCNHHEKRNELLEHYIEEFSELVFSTEVSAFLEAFYGEKFVWRWPIFDIIDDSALKSYDSTTWHRDGGMRGMLKVFLYLNSVEEHHCNTLIIGEQASNKLGEMGALPLEMDKRLTDISEYLNAMPEKVEALSYPLATGDLLVFDPTRLAHRCKPPLKGNKRYTICYSVFPESSFG